MKTRRAIPSALLILGLCTSLGLLDTATGQQQQKITWVREDLYVDGNTAFTNGIAVSALEKFFAFREFNKQQLESAKGGEEEKVRNDLNRAIEVLEQSLSHAVEHDNTTVSAWVSESTAIPQGDRE